MIPDTNPSAIAYPQSVAIPRNLPYHRAKLTETDPKVTGASKKTIPLMAMGSLFNAPTIEYVVDVVTRTHQADAYEMKMELRPEMTMAIIRELRCASGKFLLIFSADQSSRTNEQTAMMGIDIKLL